MNLVVVSAFSDGFLSSDCEYFADNFCICVDQGGWTAISFPFAIVLPSGFGVGYLTSLKDSENDFPFLHL